ncbi:S8 family serine peptidase [Roseomonas sp. GC11]|uniref:S8 family serine peptidase n=1 Tax=Roseomonas sp. GC11 TaxID=2950546 RepID=UPI00210D22F1|nr:S8 family serine peptidase [Roseomonas sp. GC11]MCQ4162491.1 S8 family serine peptidase [Roseomonas sp. GC11]
MDEPVFFSLPQARGHVAGGPAGIAAGGAAEAGAQLSATGADPLAGSQWHIANANTGIDVQSVWGRYSGRGVLVGIIDDGFQYTHADLAANYRTALDRDFVRKDNDAAPVDGTHNHGTAVAGVIGAAYNNAYGGSGVAWGAGLVGYQVSFGTNTSTSEILEALKAARSLDVVNNSWGYGGVFGDNFSSITFAQHGKAMEDAVRYGRGGLGTNFVFAAGNDRASGQNVNYHDFQNSPYAIAVGATDQNGAIASFSTPGAAILISAPGVGVVTTDRTGSSGYVSGDFAAVSGTSFAAPVVSGVIALMLEANSGLGYRDVQEILAYSAQKTASFLTTARTNGATDWNGGGLTYNHDFGFGLVDAHAAVRLAETWQSKSTFDNAAKLSASSTAKLALQDAGTASSTIKVGSADLEIDRVEVTVDLSHARMSDLVLTLVSPTGTESVLMSRAGLSSGGTGSTTLKFTMDSVHFWGEGVTGTWTLKVQDAASGFTGTLNSWKLDFIGDAIGNNDLYIYTDAFATLGADSKRAVLRDLDGGIDTMNFAAIKSAVQIDMNAGAKSVVLGKSLTIAAGTLIENLFTGDGNDTITGNALSNRISGGRGADVIKGGAGADVFIYARMEDKGDVITDFSQQDILDLSGLLDGLGYKGSTAMADGWVKTAQTSRGLSVMVDADGLGSAMAAQELLFLQGYTGGLSDSRIIA